MNVVSDMIDVKSYQISVKRRLKKGIKAIVTPKPIILQSDSGVRRKSHRQTTMKRCKK